MATPELHKPVPRASGPLAPFLAAAREGRLAVQRCTECATLRFPPREICSQCWSHLSDWTTVSGKGEVFSFYVMHQVYHPAFASEVPYVVAVVRLDEGPKLLTNLMNISPAEVRVGQRVMVAFERAGDEVVLPKFEVVA